MGLLNKVVCGHINVQGIRLNFMRNTTVNPECTQDSVLGAGGSFVGYIDRYVVFAVMVLFATLTVFANIFIIICVFKSRQLKRSNYSVYVVSLAISDLIICGVTVPAMALYTVFGYWPFGSGPCFMFILSDYVCASVSNIHLVVIAYDRYRAVSAPLVYRSTFTRCRARMLAASAWTVCLGFYFPGILVVRILDDMRGTSLPYECTYPANEIFMVGNVFLLAYGPPAALIVLSGLLFITIMRRNKADGIEDMVIERGQAPSTELSTMPKFAKDTRKSMIIAQNRRCLVTLLAQIILFLICWGPYIVVLPIVYLCENCVPSTIFDIVYFISFNNSTVNPILYLVFNKTYRRVFLTIFCCSKKPDM